MLVLCFELQSWRQKPGLFSREKPGLFVRSNPLFIGIIHLSLISLCVLCVLERLNHSDATGTDIKSSLHRNSKFELTVNCQLSTVNCQLLTVNC